MNKDILSDFTNEIKYIDIASVKNTYAGGCYWFNRNSITFMSNDKITPEILAHELGHAIDDNYANQIHSSNLQQDLESWKALAKEFYPALVNGNYALKNYKEFFAEVYANSYNGKSLHFSMLNKLINDKYNKIMENPDSTQAEKNLAEKVKTGLDSLINKTQSIVSDVRTQSKEERYGSNNDMIKNKLIIQNLLQNETLVQDYYKLQNAGIIPKTCLGVKDYLLGALNGNITNLATIKDKASKKGGELESLTNKFLNAVENFVNKAYASGVNKESVQNSQTSGSGNNGSNSAQIIIPPRIENNEIIPNIDNENNNFVDSTDDYNAIAPITPEINLPDMGGYDWDNFGQNDSTNTYVTSTDIQGGNINNVKNNPNNTLPSENPSSFETPTSEIEKLLSQACENLRDQVIKEAKEKYGENAVVDADVSYTIDGDGNITYHVKTFVSNNSQNSNNNPQNINDTKNSSENNAVDDAKFQAALNWVNTTFVDRYGNFDGAAFSNWVNSNYGAGQAFFYRGQDAAYALNMLLQASASGDYSGFWANVGNFGSTGTSGGGSGTSAGGAGSSSGTGGYCPDGSWSSTAGSGWGSIGDSFIGVGGHGGSPVLGGGGYWPNNSYH